MFKFIAFVAAILAVVINVTFLDADLFESFVTTMLIFIFFNTKWEVGKNNDF